MATMRLQGLTGGPAQIKESENGTKYAVLTVFENVDRKVNGEWIPDGVNIVEVTIFEQVAREIAARGDIPPSTWPKASLVDIEVERVVNNPWTGNQGDAKATLRGIAKRITRLDKQTREPIANRPATQQPSTQTTEPEGMKKAKKEANKAQKKAKKARTAQAAERTADQAPARAQEENGNRAAIATRVQQDQRSKAEMIAEARAASAAKREADKAAYLEAHPEADEAPATYREQQEAKAADAAALELEHRKEAARRTVNRGTEGEGTCSQCFRETPDFMLTAGLCPLCVGDFRDDDGRYGDRESAYVADPTMA